MVFIDYYVKENGKSDVFIYKNDKLVITAKDITKPACLINSYINNYKCEEKTKLKYMSK